VDLPERPAPARAPQEAFRAWLQWFGVGRLIATSVAVVAVIAGGYWLVRSPATPVESTLPYAATESSPVTTSNGGAGAANVDVRGGDSSDAGRAEAVDDTSVAVPPTIVVYVAGAVAVPGVYPLPADARVQQAVGAAGGMAADADVDAVNLAAFVTDGARVYVPRIGTPVPSVVAPSGGGGVNGSVDAPAAGPIDINEATVEQLDELPGVGPSTASAIVDHRESSGPYASVDDLLDVRGIGPAKLDAIRDLIRV
jgi:competence protein ComEA